MIYPILVYGHPILRKISKEVSPDHPGLKTFIADLWGTMYKSDGVGLAAPQVGNPVRIFVIDTSAVEEEEEKLAAIKKTFINPKIIERTGEPVLFNEGCLSLPNLREDVEREPRVRIQYYDEEFTFHDETYKGVAARVIQHEYDHLDGILFPDRLKPIKRRVLKGKLTALMKGNFNVKYKTILPKEKAPLFKK
jgi:peptide deformylase